MKTVVAAILIIAVLSTATVGKNTFDCSTDCVKCVGRTVLGTQQTVTIDVSECKQGGSLSWMCCKDQGCTATMCDAKPFSGGAKCEEVLTATYQLAAEATTLHVEYHDGQLCGNVDCGSPGHPNCCGGASTSCKSAVSGVCRRELDLITACGECSTDSDCTAEEGVCLLSSECTAGKCVYTFKPPQTVCRASLGACDVDEFCTGFTAMCPPDVIKPAGTECRESAGCCDNAEYCDGEAPTCPPDEKVPSGTLCRKAAVAPDGTTCDASEVCDGASNDCPKDTFLPAGTVCRPATDTCDVAEVCTGSSDACPGDLRRDSGFSMKCGTDCYVCAAPPKMDPVNPHSQAKEIGGCVVGACKAIHELKWPDCAEACIAAKCKNHKDLSNAALLKCNSTNGEWKCTEKLEGDAVKNGVCQPAWTPVTVPPPQTLKPNTQCDVVHPTQTVAPTTTVSPGKQVQHPAGQDDTTAKKTKRAVTVVGAVAGATILVALFAWWKIAGGGGLEAAPLIG